MTTYQQSPWNPPTPSTYYAGPGTYAALELKSKLEGLFLSWLAIRAGVNFYRLHPNDMGAAVLHGATALRRWWVWLAFAQAWLFFTLLTLWLLYMQNHKVQGEAYPDISGGLRANTYKLIAVSVLSLFTAVLIPYCRNVDFSLFKRNALYWVLSPLVKLLDRVSPPLLYLIGFVPLLWPV